jgi:hypothetical protein
MRNGCKIERITWPTRPAATGFGWRAGYRRARSKRNVAVGLPKTTGKVCRLAENVALFHSLWNPQSNGIILARSNSTLARPYMARSSVFNRL